MTAEITISQSEFAIKTDMKPVDIYLSHVSQGRSMRSLARQLGVHPSTVLRRVRSFENRRDDPLFDQAMERLSETHTNANPENSGKEFAMNDSSAEKSPTEKLVIDRKSAKRFLRRLSEKGAFLALASDMENGVIMRNSPSGETIRSAIIGRSDAQALALYDWVKLCKTGRVCRYEITAAGEAALRRMLAEDRSDPTEYEAPVNIFGEQHRDWGERNEISEKHGRTTARQVNLSESPITLLSRRKDKDGKPFLSHELVCAGERLREDFELSKMGPKITQNWDKFLTGRTGTGFWDTGHSGVNSAAKRFRSAMDFLGPGLSEVALRCCCFLEGMETAEKRLGWSARSGKIVLRIALQRLKQHYDNEFGPLGPMIG